MIENELIGSGILPTESTRRVAAMMIMSRHVEDDLDSFSNDDCFLNTSIAFQPATNSEAKLEGNYLYHDERRSWIRSGSVSSGGCSGLARSFAAQHSEDEKSTMRRGGLISIQ